MNPHVEAVEAHPEIETLRKYQREALKLYAADVLQNIGDPFEGSDDGVELIGSIYHSMSDSKFRRLVDEVESPVELLMLEAMKFQLLQVPFTVTPQGQIGPYRVDFLIEDERKPGRRLVIECDGHDYHERTKEQAKSDRKRDRWLMANGYLVMRFTGSEIWTAPLECACEALEFFFEGEVE